MAIQSTTLVARALFSKKLNSAAIIVTLASSWNIEDPKESVYLSMFF